MKKFLLYTFIALSSLITTAPAAAGSPLEIVAIERALSKNDIKLLGLLMDDWVTLTYNNKANIYNKFQAQNIIKDIISFEGNQKFIMQKVGRGNQDNTYFAIGTYSSSNKSYLLYFYLVYNESKNQYLLKEIRID